MKDNSEIYKKIYLLQVEVIRHTKLYFDGVPEISDQKFDELWEKLKAAETKYNPPERITNKHLEFNSEHLTKKIPHNVPVLSLGKMNTLTEVESFAPSSSKFTYILEPKIDGASVFAYYYQRQLKYIVSRGENGIGDDLTYNLSHLFPNILPIGDGNFCIRAEVYFNPAEFEKFNRTKMANKYKNPRNAVAIIRGKDQKLIRDAPLRIIAHDLMYSKKPSNDSYSKSMDFLKCLGVSIPPRMSFNQDSLYEFFFEEHHTELTWQTDYPMDGLVIKVDAYSDREKLGDNGSYPYWAYAFKFKNPEAMTLVEDIEFFVGKTGKVTPRAKLEPVEISGSTITYATLNNFCYLSALDVNRRDVVIVSKRNEIIPCIEEVISKNSIGHFLLPSHCPSCGELLYETNDSQGWSDTCKNLMCSGRVLSMLTHFTSRGYMNIKDLSVASLEKLIGAGYIATAPDLFYLDLEELSILGANGKKIYAEIQKSKSNPANVLLSSLGISNVGRSMSKLLLENFGSILNIMEHVSIHLKKTDKAFSHLSGIEATMSTLLVHALWENRDLIESILSVPGLKTAYEAPQKKGNLFDGQSWCVTGAFENFNPREKAMEIVQALGGRVVSGVSGKTTHILVGYGGGGSKRAKIEKFGTKEVNEKEFMELIKPYGY